MIDCESPLDISSITESARSLPGNYTPRNLLGDSAASERRACRALPGSLRAARRMPRKMKATIILAASPKYRLGSSRQ